MHLRRATLEEFTASYHPVGLSVKRTSIVLQHHDNVLSALKSFRTANEKSVTGEDCLASRVLHEIADAVLRVARGMDGPDRDVADLKSLSVLWRLGDSLAVLAANDGELLIVQISKLGAYICQLVSFQERKKETVRNAG